MSISIIGTPGAVAGTSITMPTHAIGDLLLIFAYRNGSTSLSTKPAAGGTVPAWVDIDATLGTNTQSIYSAQFVATATNHTSGTWTNASDMAVIVIRGQDTTTPIGGHAVGAGGTGANTSQAPAVTQSFTDGTSLLVQLCGHRLVTAWSAATSGYTSQASVAATGGVDLLTKTSSTTDGLLTQVNTAASSGFYGAQVEIIALNANKTVSPPAGTASASGPVPGIALKVLAPVGTSTASGPAPGVGLGVPAPVATSNASGPIPGVALKVSPPVATASASAPIPTVAAGFNVLSPAATASASAPTPGIALKVLAPVATASASAPIPTVSAGTTLAPPVATATASAPTPGLALKVFAPAATASASAPIPTVVAGSANQNVLAPVATASASAPVPSVVSSSGAGPRLVRYDSNDYDPNFVRFRL